MFLSLVAFSNFSLFRRDYVQLRLTTFIQEFYYDDDE